MIEEGHQIYAILKNLKTVQQGIKCRMHEHFKEMDFTAPQGMLIFLLSQHGPLKISEISEHMGLSNSTVSGIVDRLEMQGAVERTRSDKDRRVVFVTLKQATYEKVTGHEQVIDNYMQQVLLNATASELKIVEDGLTMLSHLLHQKDEGDEKEC